jgi:hypothetical protein
MDLGADGARELADVVSMTLKATTQSGVVLQVEPRPSPEAVTMPARNV